jgi:D-tyrosyl-tRNA(Tyr) deacylase
VRAVVQRVREARVEVDKQIVGQIGSGLAVLLGVQQGDYPAQAAFLARKIVALRIFSDPQGKMNLSLAQAGGELLVVSQITLYADTRGGNRPSFVQAAPPHQAQHLYQVFLDELTRLGHPPQTGLFQAEMFVHLVAHGPVTILLDTADFPHLAG